MNLRDLQYLVAVADLRHFGRAAEACFVSQPTLSTQIKKLERELGVELIERHPRQVLLTASGAQIVERARSMLRTAEDIEEIARRAQDPEAGRLRLGLIPTLAPYLLAHIVAPLKARFPRLELLLVEEKTETIHQQMREGRLDLAVLALPLEDDQLHEELLFTEEFVLAVPKGHPLADVAPTARATSRKSSGLRTIDSSLLSTEPILLLEEGHCLREQALAVCQLAGATERSDFRATSLETLRQMVAAGAGITLLPELAVISPLSQTDDIVFIPFTSPTPSRQIGLIWRRTTVNSELYRAIGEVVRTAMSGLSSRVSVVAAR